MLAPTIPNPMNPTCLSLFLQLRTLTSCDADNTATNAPGMATNDFVAIRLIGGRHNWLAWLLTGQC